MAKGSVSKDTKVERNLDAAMVAALQEAKSTQKLEKGEKKGSALMNHLESVLHATIDSVADGSDDVQVLDIEETSKDSGTSDDSGDEQRDQAGREYLDSIDPKYGADADTAISNLQSYGGANFYVGTGDFFKAILAGIMASLDQANTLTDVQVFMTNSAGGFKLDESSDAKEDSSKLDLSANSTYSLDPKGSLVAQVAKTITDAANADALKTMMQAFGQIGSMLSNIVGGLMDVIGSRKKASDEQKDVDRLKYAIDAVEKEDPIPGSTGMTDSTKPEYSEKHAKGLHKMMDGLYDVTKDDQHFGSQAVKTIKVKDKKSGKEIQQYEYAEAECDHGKFNKADYKKEDFEIKVRLVDGTETTVSVVEVLQSATSPQKREIVQKLKSQLDRAKDKLKSKEDQLSRTRQTQVQGMQGSIKTFSEGSSSFASTTFTQAKGQADAANQIVQSIKSNIDKMKDTLSQSRNTATQSIGEQRQALDQIVRTLASLGK